MVDEKRDGQTHRDGECDRCGGAGVVYLDHLGYCEQCGDYHLEPCPDCAPYQDSDTLPGDSLGDP